MTALPPLPSTPPQKTIASGTPRSATPSLATFLGRIAPLVDVALPAGDPRQETAAPGKPLPDEDADVTIDPALLFAGHQILPEIARPVSPFGGLGVESGPAVGDRIAISVDTAPAPACAPNEGNPDLIVLPRADTQGGTASPFIRTAAEGKAATKTDTDTRTANDVMAKQEQPAAPITTARVAPLIEIAGRVFAQAIHRAVTSEDSRAQRAAEPAAITAAATTDIAAHAVTATGDAQHAAHDLTQRDWPRAMIDRIETLRDAANAADTSIRLIPDALGTIDVKLHTAGETVHVHFAAEQAQTRALLAEAQSRLVELADARGLKLSQSGVDGDTGQHRQPPARIAPSPTPRRASEPTVTTDHRIA